MKDKRKLIWLTVLLCFGIKLWGCTGTVTRRPVDDEVVKTTDFTEVDIRAMCQKMARSLIEVPQISHADNPPNIAFAGIKNRTLQELDTYNLLSSIRKNLVAYGEGKFVFLNREITEKLERERRLKSRGELTTADANDPQSGADFFLSGYAHENERREKGVRESYYRFSFQLTDTHGGIVWEDDYEFKKAAKVGSAYR